MRLSDSSLPTPEKLEGKFPFVTSQRALTPFAFCKTKEGCCLAELAENCVFVMVFFLSVIIHLNRLRLALA